MTKPARTILVALLVVACLIGLTSALNSNQLRISYPAEQLSMSRLLASLKANKVERAQWQDTTLSGRFIGGGEFEALVPDYNSPGGRQLQEELKASNANWQYASPPVFSTVLTALSFLAFPVMVLTIIYLIAIRPAQWAARGLLLRPHYGINLERNLIEAQAEIARLQDIITELSAENLRLRKTLSP